MNDDLGPAGPGRASTDILATKPADRGAERAPWALVGGAGALVLALVGGVTYAVGALSPAGTQPADALPTGAFTSVTLDLDPSVGQKLDGFRFLRKFPALRDRVPLDGDVREVMFDAIADEAGWDQLDYATDVEPWLGQRLAVAVYAPVQGVDGAEPTVVVALQVTDEDKAQQGLDRLATAALRGTTDGSRPGWVFSGDYALLAASQQAADRVAAQAEAGSLAADEHFAVDIAAADDGILTAWVDMGAAGRALGDDSLFLGSASGVLGSAAGASGRSTLVARFDGPDVFEVVGRATGSTTAGWAAHPVTGMGELPASSVVAVGLADSDELVPRAFDSIKASFGDRSGDLDQMVGSLSDEVGIRLPEDVAVLAGDNLVAALDGEAGAQVQLGARMTTDVPAAQGVLDKVEAALRRRGADVPIVRREAGGGSDLVIASTRRQADRMSATGTLGDVSGFQRALPDLAAAHVALWVDPAAVAHAFLGGSGGAVDENLEPIDGIGVTVSSGKGERTATYRFRLVAH